jgi:hypothetical protein
MIGKKLKAINFVSLSVCVLPLLSLSCEWFQLPNSDHLALNPWMIRSITYVLIVLRSQGETPGACPALNLGDRRQCITVLI